MSVLGDHLRAARVRHGVSQRSLAIRAGTTQAAISRIETGLESPSYERFTQLLFVLGERPLLTIAPLELDVDRADLAAGRRLAPSSGWPSRRRGTSSRRRWRSRARGRAHASARDRHADHPARPR